MTLLPPIELCFIFLLEIYKKNKNLILPVFQKIILWCEFPQEISWKKAESLMKGIPHEIYVAVRNVKEYRAYKKKTKLPLYPWPILSQEEGYWFSGFSSKESIDKLKQYKGLKIKIDLEPPLPKWKYGTFKIVMYALKKIFQRGKNNEYLKKVIYEFAGKDSGVILKSVNLLINEFPFPRWYLKNHGTYLDLKKGMDKNYMCYTSFAGQFFRPFIRMYLKIFTKRAVRRNPYVRFSVGLIGTGILHKEGTYKHPNQLRQDLQMVHDSGAKAVAVYSLDGILKRDRPREWIEVIREFI